MSCNQNKLTNNEVKIISDSFATNIINFAPLLHSQKINQAFVKTISEVEEDIRNNNKLTTTKKGIIRIANNLTSKENLSKLKHEAKISGEYLKINLDDFEANKMSLIHEYKFVNQLLLTLYWSNWRDDSGFGFKIIPQSLDTMMLFESTKYEIPISIDNGKNNSSPFWIMSNSLQNGDKNKISIKTEKYKKGIFIKKFEITALNRITGEEWKTKDSIKYRLIKKKTDENNAYNGK